MLVVARDLVEAVGRKMAPDAAEDQPGPLRVLATLTGADLAGTRYAGHCGLASDLKRVPVERPCNSYHGGRPRRHAVRRPGPRGAMGAGAVQAHAAHVHGMPWCKAGCLAAPRDAWPATGPRAMMPPPPPEVNPPPPPRYKHPLYDREGPVVVGGDYITTETGTGLVHTAPGHGVEDYQVKAWERLLVRV